jgi:hypothetical protein
MISVYVTVIDLLIQFAKSKAACAVFLVPSRNEHRIDLYKIRSRAHLDKYQTDDQMDKDMNHLVADPCPQSERVIILAEYKALQSRFNMVAKELISSTPVQPTTVANQQLFTVCQKILFSLRHLDSADMIRFVEQVQKVCPDAVEQRGTELPFFYNVDSLKLSQVQGNLLLEWLSANLAHNACVQIALG